MLNLNILNNMDLDTAPLAPNWQGALAHIGPVDGTPPLLVALDGKTTCGTLTMLAGVLTIGARRLQSFNKTAFVHELIEASFAFHFDWRYVDNTAKPNYQAPDQPVEFSSLLIMDSFLRKPMRGHLQWASYYQPIMKLFHLCNVVNFILPEQDKPTFETWLMALNTRMESIATAPLYPPKSIDDFDTEADFWDYHTPRRGPPLPPQVLELDTDLDGLDLDALALENLRRLDHRNNRFLRSPDEMRALGFTGDAYGGAA